MELRKARKGAMILNALKIFPFFPLLWVVSKSINWRAISRKIEAKFFGWNWLSGDSLRRYYWYMEILLKFIQIFYFYLVLLITYTNVNLMHVVNYWSSKHYLFINFKNIWSIFYNVTTVMHFNTVINFILFFKLSLSYTKLITSLNFLFTH